MRKTHKMKFKSLKASLMLSALLIGGVSLSTPSHALDLSSQTIGIVYLSAQKNSLLVNVSNKTEGLKAQETIDKMGQRAISFLSDASLSTEQKQEEFRKLLQANFDMDTIGRFTLGKNWRTASAAQQKEFQKLFENYIVRIYSGRFNDYQGQRFDVTSFQDTGKSDVLVSSYIVPDGGNKVKVDWRVRNKNGQYKIIDVIIEGVSMSLTQRSDFSSVIQRGGGDIDVLISHLKK